MKRKIVFALLLGIFTTGIISFTIVSVNVGYCSLFLKVWLRSWGIAYAVVIPAILVLCPRIEKFVNYLFPNEHR